MTDFTFYIYIIGSLMLFLYGCSIVNSWFRRS